MWRCLSKVAEDGLHYWDQPGGFTGYKIDWNNVKKY